MSLKAFELAQVLDHVQLGGDKSKSMVECIDCSLPELYVGTNDCFIIHFLIEKGFSPTGKTVFRSKLQRHKHLGQRKAISQILCCPSVAMLLCLCEGNVYMLNMKGLELKVYHGNKEILKGVTVMARNDTSNTFNPYGTEICVGTRRKQIHLYSIDKEKIQLISEVSLTDIPRALAIDGNTVCTVADCQYTIIDLLTGKQQQLFTHEANAIPMIKRIGSDEFLLSGPTDSIGMIVSPDGLSRHQPLNWADGLISVGFSYPYVLILGKSTITIHSMIDKQQKQAIGFQAGVAMGDYDGMVLAAGKRSVFALIPVSLDQQIQILLIEKRIDEALELAVVANSTDQEKFGTDFMNLVNIKAGFVQFSRGQFGSCQQIFSETDFDLKEVIALYPSLLPSDIVFTPSQPPFHNIKDIQSMAKGSKTLLAEAKKFILDFLEACHKNSRYSLQLKDIDTALVKLYAECSHGRLPDFVSHDNACLYPDTIQILTQYKRWHSLALYHSYNKEHDQAMSTWLKILQSEYHDSTFPGIEFLVTYLTNLNDAQVIWRYTSSLLDVNQNLAVKVFIDHSSDSDDLLAPESVVDFLGRYPIALLLFLEYLIFAKNIEREKYHTHLALTYLDGVLKLLKERIQQPDKLTETRTKLQAFLEYSNLYRVTTLLSRIGDCNLPLEISILYGKLEQHDKALEILVYELKDHAAAERHCQLSSKGKSKIECSKLYMTLLSIYLEPTNTELKDEFVIPAVDLINNHAGEFDAVQVLSLLPEDWSVGLVSKFLTGCLRRNLSEGRVNKIDKALRRALYLDSRYVFVTSSNGATSITDDSSCHVCKKLFTIPVVARYPNGVLAHSHCARNKNVCPITGKDFSK